MFKKLGMAVIVVCALLVVAGVVMAQEASKTETAPSAVTVTEVTPAAAVNVGNKVCPVMGEKIVELGKDTVEYEGKIYNMCCPMCKDKFLADPRGKPHLQPSSNMHDIHGSARCYRASLTNRHTSPASRDQ